mmetsp:Transcript_42426/g.40675  ORF Transcript_42426/g.40675 Transcript_42426/m.40675 type:complete len:145 (+) Transcript_42426:16-450(+)
MESGTIQAKSVSHILLVMFFEFFSQILFLLSIILSNGNPLATAAGLFIAIMFADPHTGAHLNPSVTLTVYFVEKKWGNALLILAYWTAQIAGGYVGLGIAYSWGGDSLSYLAPTFSNPESTFTENFFMLIYIEFVLTLFLMISI